MSRAYDAKQFTIAAFPIREDGAVEFFLDWLDMSESDFTYEFKMSASDYIYGDVDKD